MISYALGYSFLLIAGTGDPTTIARKGYIACLEKVMVTALDEKLDPAAFDGSLGQACPSEAAALRQAAVGADVKAGMKRADSERMIGEEIDDHQATAKERYREFKERNAKPTLR
jgi:hypothetical protein